MPKASLPEQVRQALASAIAPMTEPGLIVIHSSLLHLGLPPADLEPALMAAIRHLLTLGHTIAVPALTFSFCRGREFDQERSASETGLLADWCLRMPQARRTPHPIYSFVAIGPLASELCACRNSTTFGPDSLFATFAALNARMVMIGCGWRACTQFHHAEELARVPYRLYKDFSGIADFGDGPRQTRATMFVRDPAIPADNDFSSITAELKAAGKVWVGALGRGSVESAWCRDLMAVASSLLAADPLAFVSEPAKVELALRRAKAARDQPPLKIALLGTRTLEPLRQAVLEQVASLIPDRRVELYAPAYGQLGRDVRVPGSDLRRFAADVSIFVERAEDVLGVDSLVDGADFDPAVAADYAALIAEYAGAVGGKLFVLDFAPLAPSALGAADTAQDNGVSRLVGDMTRRLREGLAGLPETHVIDFASLTRTFVGGAVTDPRLWYLGRIPFAPSFQSHLAAKISGWILAATMRTARLLVLDLDNTLWGGILGEDMVEGLAIGGDFPGNAFADFQRAIKRLAARGIALAVCSKNDEANARDAMRTLPGMILREDDFAAFRINWRPKWENLRALAEELSLGLGNILFVDDNPAERESMRRHLPEVQVLDLPEDPCLYVHALLASPFLECLEVTAEDRQRTQSYAHRRQIEDLRGSVTDERAFWASLDTRLDLDPLARGNRARVLQLIAKTNQFNTTTRRHDGPALDALRAEGADVLVVASQDRFSPRENIGVLILRWNHPEPKTVQVDSFLLSCRILGRGIEQGVLAAVAVAAHRRGMTAIQGEIIPTARNTPVRDLYRAAGFEDRGDGMWRLVLDHGPPAVPDWLTVTWGSPSDDEARS